ncbi:uncharacterized protein F4822DRAFT_444645 [Hypoxylon trugodes]|uniref:uncharacterized protein n=1 Tax=Hypoxylon trugodes TaxID=326681 RepID=UPI0021969130|nr:uncharacterized protein F4822DRAFT_444645 [Hypoxylon trugodes]KAI1386142.1 hypothetical protein F4822DRAFT_444645 [Hypoxylon trugodes]
MGKLQDNPTWLCCDCRLAVMTTRLDTHCTNCGRQRCADCSVFLYKTLQRPSASSSSNVSEPLSTKPDLLQKGEPPVTCVESSKNGRVDYGDDHKQLKQDSNLEEKTPVKSKKEPPNETIRSLELLEVLGIGIDSEPEVLEMVPLSPEEGLVYAASVSETDESEQDEEIHDYQAIGNSPIPGSHYYLNHSTSLMISRWLESLQGDPNYEVIAQVCEGILQEASGRETTTTRNATAPNNSTGNYQTNRLPQKRKASDLEGNDDENSATPSVATEESPTGNRQKPKYACHFLKMNQHLYTECRRTGYGQVCHLAEHLRKAHRLKEHSCRICWRSFDNSEALRSHQTDASENNCRETGGTPIERIKISKARTGDFKKWFWIWEKLFPNFQKPESPYWEPFGHDEQLFSSLRQFFNSELSSALPPENLQAVMTTLTRFRENWVTNPPEPRQFAPLPTPAATQATDDATNIHTEPSRHSPQDPLGIGTDPLPLSDEVVLDGNDPSLRTQEDAESAAAEEILIAETSPASAMNFDIWVPSYDDGLYEFDAPNLDLGDLDHFDWQIPDKTAVLVPVNP